MEKRKSRDLCVIIGLFIFIFFSIISIHYIGIRKNSQEEERKEIEEFFKVQEEYEPEITTKEQTSEAKEEKIDNYIMLLEIPQISLKKGIYGIGLWNNTISKNIQLINGTDMPDIHKGNVIMAAHRGNSSVSFFNKLDTLNIESIINIYYKGKKYVYKLNNSYEIEKNGTAKIIRNMEKNTVTLITCKKNNETKQVVYIGYLYEESIYSG